LAEVADFFLAAFAIETPDAGEASIGETHTLGFAHNFPWNRFHGMLLQLELHVIYFFELVEEPRVNRSHLRDLFDGMTLTNRILNVGETIGMRGDQALSKNLRLDFSGADALASVESANPFLQGFFESSADSHHFADRFHLRA